jgi:hypothetical protein
MGLSIRYAWLFFRANGCDYLLSPRTKKADVAEHPEVFDHVGLLTNEPLGTAELLSIESSDDFLGKAAVKRFATLPRHPSYAHEREMQWDFCLFL